MRIIFTKEIPGLGEKIKNLRKQSSKTITELAAIAGVSSTHWTRIEKEQMQVPIETLRGIEKALDVDFEINE